MKFMIFPSAKSDIAHIASAPSPDCVKRYVRSRYGRGGNDFCQTGDTAIEDIEMRLEAGVLEARTRAIGATGPWGEWRGVEGAKR